MQYTSTILALAALTAEVVAYPNMAGAMMNAEIKKRGQSISGTYVPDPAQVAGIFDAELQYVSTTGIHAFVPPLKTDQRGPCPGLNAMANHGYIPHNGVATIQEFITGTYEAFGMGVDLATFLAIYGAVFDGDLTSWSIGGPAPSVTVPGILVQPQGISGSHNKYESDVSPTRGDLFEYGDDYTVQMSQWEQLYAYQSGVSNAESNYNLAVLQEFRSKRFQQSINNNPYFFNGPFTGVAVQPAAYTFIYRFMGNKSAEHPEGQLTQEVLKSFFSITENNDGTFTWTEGHERIPDNWYKRAIGDEYTIPFFQEDLVEEAMYDPEFISVGGNTGTTNSFTGLDIENLTGGVFNAATLTEGNNAACFAFQAALLAAPDFLRGAFDDIAPAVSILSKAVANALTGMNCPKLNSMNYNQFNTYPGYQRSISS